MGGNSVSGFGDSKDPKIVAKQIAAKEDNFKSLQRQNQYENINKQIQEQLKRYNDMNNAKDIEAALQTLKELKEQLSQQVNYSEQSPGFVGMAIRKLEQLKHKNDMKLKDSVIEAERGKIDQQIKDIEQQENNDK